MRAGIEAFKQDLRREAGVAAASASWGVPGDLIAQDALTVPGRDAPFLTSLLLVDADFVQTYGMDIVAGRGFSASFATDADEAFLLNETAAHRLGWAVEEAVGQPLAWHAWNGTLKEGTVVGVIRDFHIQSLHEAVEPVVLTLYPDAASRLAVRIRTDTIEATLAAIEAVWAKHVPEWPFEYLFLDAQFAALHASDRQLGRLLFVFAGISLLIAGLGLLGMATYATARRTREIGVRKVLGASVVQLVALLSKEFALLLGGAVAIAVPLAYLGLER